MQLDKLAEIIQQTDETSFEQVSPRRGILKSFGLKVAAITLPFMAGSALNKAYGQTTDNLIDTLNYALMLKYMQHELYRIALDAKEPLIPEDAMDAFKKILADKQGHVDILKFLINDLGGTVNDAPSFDFSGGQGKTVGPFAKVFNNYLSFLEMAQMMEDSIVRAYIHVAGSLTSRDTLIYHIFKIRSMDSRHAAHIRAIRVPYGVKPWITKNETGIDNPAVIPFYANEQNTVQKGINMVGVNGYPLDAAAVTEAFDEPIDRPAATDLFGMFVVS